MFLAGQSVWDPGEIISVAAYSIGQDDGLGELADGLFPGFTKMSSG